MKKSISIFAQVIVLLLLLSSCAQNGMTNNSSDTLSAEALFGKVCPTSEALEAARQSNVVLIEDGVCTSGKKLFESFTEKVHNKEKASVIIANCYYLHEENTSREYYESEKDNYPMLFFTKAEYDGEVFRVSARKCTERSVEYEEEFKYLLHLTQPPYSSIFYPYEYYVLTDDDTLTSSDLLLSPSDSFLNYYFLFTDKR